MEQNVPPLSLLEYIHRVPLAVYIYLLLPETNCLYTVFITLPLQGHQKYHKTDGLQVEPGPWGPDSVKDQEEGKCGINTRIGRHTQHWTKTGQRSWDTTILI